MSIRESNSSITFESEPAFVDVVLTADEICKEYKEKVYYQ